MFNTISWASYWTALAITLAVYYLFIFLVYYRNDLSRLPALLRNRPRDGPNMYSSNEEFHQLSTDADEGIVYSCLDELSAFFEEAKKRKWNKSELIYSLQSIIKKYSTINTSGYKASVSNVIINQSEHICSIHLNKEELEHVWLG